MLPQVRNAEVNKMQILKCRKSAQKIRDEGMSERKRRRKKGRKDTTEEEMVLLFYLIFLVNLKIKIFHQFLFIRTIAPTFRMKKKKELCDLNKERLLLIENQPLTLAAFDFKSFALIFQISPRFYP